MLSQIRKRNSMNYLNPAKLERAIQWAKANGKENDAEAIKAMYIALGGAVSGEEAPVVKPEEKPEVKAKSVEKIVKRKRSSK
jgi:hypothetical protein